MESTEVAVSQDAETTAIMMKKSNVENRPKKGKSHECDDKRGIDQQQQHERRNCHVTVMVEEQQRTGRKEEKHEIDRVAFTGVTQEKTVLGPHKRWQ